MDLEAAHKACANHRAQILASDVVGCFYCLKTYVPGEITDWCDDDKTAICPRCGIDSVIGSLSGWRLTSEFLARMHAYWFERTVTWEEVQRRSSWWRRFLADLRTKEAGWLSMLRALLAGAITFVLQIPYYVWWLDKAEAEFGRAVSTVAFPTAAYLVVLARISHEH